MNLSKQTVVDQITVTENEIILFREATRIFEDGKLISQTYHRTSLNKGDDISEQDPKVQAVCNAVWGK